MESALKNVDQSTPKHCNEMIHEPKSSKSLISSYLLRILVFATTLVAALLMAFDKETQNIPIKLGPDLPDIFVPILAKSSYLSAFKYFVAVNAVACAFTALSVILSLAWKSSKSSPAAWIAAMDTVILALVSTGAGAAGAIGLLGEKGNTHVGWRKVCDYYGLFCRHVLAALLVSIIGMAFLLLLITKALLVTPRKHRF